MQFTISKLRRHLQLFTRKRTHLRKHSKSALTQRLLSSYDLWLTNIVPEKIDFNSSADYIFKVFVKVTLDQTRKYVNGYEQYLLFWHWFAKRENRMKTLQRRERAHSPLMNIFHIISYKIDSRPSKFTKIICIHVQANFFYVSNKTRFDVNSQHARTHFTNSI